MTVESSPPAASGETACGFVALIGAPNVGKSTLVNALVGSKVTIVSRKVQTTRALIRGIVIEDNAQIILVDTPGIFSPKRRLDRAMVSTAWSGAHDADLVCVLLDAKAGIDEEADAIFAFLRTVPAISNRVKPPETYVVTGDRGKQVYYAYGCNGCHGDSGLGQYDLRKGPAKYPTDDELIAWIKHPERLRPGIAMPTWDGVIQEDEYPPLVAHVRSLAVGAATP